NFTGVINRFYVFKDDLNLNRPDDTQLQNIDLDDCSGATMANYTNGANSAATCNSSTSATSSDCSTPSVLPSCPTGTSGCVDRKGWFMDLIQNGAGEQTVTTPVIAGGLVFFSTNRPIPPTPGSCIN